MPIATKWTEKYRPESLKRVLGNGKAIEELRAWAQSWERGEPITGAAILYGPAGTGKTSAALALASEFDWDYIEMNASDARTAGMIQKIAGPASQSRTFSGKPRLVILDEADNLHGTADRGGAAAMLKLVRSTSQPVLLIANEYYEIEKPLRDAMKGIQFRSVRSTTIAQALREICREEDVNCDPDALMLIAERAGGDMRSGINDLQAAAQGQTELKLEDVATAERDVKSSIFKVLEVIFKGNNAHEALQASYALDESPEDLINWVDENLPLAYKGLDLFWGYDRLARADIFLGRVRRRQVYGLWRYASFLMTGGVQAAKATPQPRLRCLPAAQPLAQDGTDPQGAQRSRQCRQKDRPALPCLSRVRALGADGLRGAAAQRQAESSPAGSRAGSGGGGDRSAPGQRPHHEEGADYLRGGSEDSKRRGDRGYRDGVAQHSAAFACRRCRGAWDACERWRRARERGERRAGRGCAGKHFEYNFL